MLFIYYIAPSGGNSTDALVWANLSAPNVDAAKRYAQTVRVPGLKGSGDLEVILHDAQGREVWRGPYSGNK